MNRLLVGYLLGAILLVEAAAMAPALLIALFYGDGDAMALAKSILVLLVVGLPLRFGCQPRERNFRAREGFLVVALSWVALSAFGALPFVFSGELPNYEDAFFEAVSGFTTTGATVTTHFEGAPHGIMFWRHGLCHRGLQPVARGGEDGHCDPDVHWFLCRVHRWWHQGMPHWHDVQAGPAGGAAHLPAPKGADRAL